MTARLRGALRRGGSITATAERRWAVRRSRDMRGRIIGHIPDLTFQSWRLAGRIRRLGDALPEVWIWTGEVSPAIEVASPSHQVRAILNFQPSETCYLSWVVQICPAAQRAELVGSIQAFHADYCLLHSAPSIAGMDWRGLGYGVRVDATPQNGPTGELVARRGAGRRLNRLSALLGPARWQLWLRIAVHLWTPKTFERRAHMTMAALAEDAPDIVGTVVRIYTGRTELGL